jgi:two-component system cell cycle response regulator
MLGDSAQHGMNPEPVTGGASDTNPNRRVLIVEDDAFLRQLLRVSLRRGGYDVVEVTDGARAWEFLQREHVPLVLTDWMMPGIDGPGLIRRIRDAGWPSYTYVLLLTALSKEGDVLAGMNAGADDYLTKPFSRDMLLARLAAGARVVDQDARLRKSLATEAARAARDDLTGLLTRRAALERISAELNRAERAGSTIAVVLADLDNFKRVNDEYGHEAGDEALRALGRLLRRELRDYDIAARWGGDEFLVILPGTTQGQALLAAERIRALLEAAPLPYGDKDLPPLRVSLGVSASIPGTTTSLKRLLRQADEGLYLAKESGRNRVCVFEAANSKVEAPQSTFEALSRESSASPRA